MYSPTGQPSADLWCNSIAASLLAAANGTSVASSGALGPYVVPGDAPTIQAAIDLAVATGVSNVYVRPGLYSADFEMADGVNVVSLVQQGLATFPLSGTPPASPSVTPVIITGSVSMSAGTAILQGLTLTSPLILTGAGATLNCSGCVFSTPGAPALLNTGTGSNLNLLNCTVQGGQFLASTGGGLQIEGLNSFISATGVDTVSDAFLTIYYNGCFVTQSVLYSGGSVAMEIFGGAVVAASDTVGLLTATQAGAYVQVMASQTIWQTSGAGAGVGIIATNTTGRGFYKFTGCQHAPVLSVPSAVSQVSYVGTADGTSGSFQTLSTKFSSASQVNAFVASPVVQSGAQTVVQGAATQVTLLAIPILNNSAATISVLVSGIDGSSATPTDATGASISGLFICNAAGNVTIVGSLTSSIWVTSDGQVAVEPTSNNTVNIIVTTPSTTASSYNWSGTATYLPVSIP